MSVASGCASSSSRLRPLAAARNASASRSRSVPAQRCRFNVSAPSRYASPMVILILIIIGPAAEIPLERRRAQRRQDHVEFAVEDLGDVVPAPFDAVIGDAVL